MPLNIASLLLCKCDPVFVLVDVKPSIGNQLSDPPIITYEFQPPRT